MTKKGRHKFCGGPRTETEFVKWSASRKRLRTAGLDHVADKRQGPVRRGRFMTLLSPGSLLPTLRNLHRQYIRGVHPLSEYAECIFSPISTQFINFPLFSFNLRFIT